MWVNAAVWKKQKEFEKESDRGNEWKQKFDFCIADYVIFLLIMQCTQTGFI